MLTLQLLNQYFIEAVNNNKKAPQLSLRCPFEEKI